ncbi:uncharacterized protein DS421_17g591900 [Arachis hypogaea]|nr:uncharacterized protein DS421_17g591900 [Arachis hypogaea]
MGRLPEKINGDAGYRSPYLSHAKRALYHLSYIPTCTHLMHLYVTAAMYSEVADTYNP